jgi:glycosyltransferase involved in cell wall biosynthesis
MTPLVSVIMPAHNAARFLQEAVASVQAQTYTHWELLILDDASTDNTLALAQALANEDSRIQAIPLPAQGSPSKVRNNGLALAKGEYIGFLDSDDRYLPNALTQLLTGYEQYPDATAVYGFADLMDETGQSTEDGLRLIPDETTGQLVVPSFYSHDWHFLLEGGLSCMLPGLLIKKSTLDRVGNLEEQFIAAEDYQFYMRLMFDSKQTVYYLPHYVYQYRVYAGSLTKTPEKAAHILQSVLDVMTWIFEQPQLPSEYQPLRSRCLTHCYRYLIRERIINNQPSLARQMVWHAYSNPAISRSEWMKLCGPLLVRSYLPTVFNNQLRVWKEKTRLAKEKQRLKQPV